MLATLDELPPPVGMTRVKFKPACKAGLAIPVATLDEQPSLVEMV